MDDNPSQGTGLLFEELTAENIKKHIARAVELYKRTEGNVCLKNIRKRAMEQDFSWEASAKEYIALYEKLISR